MMHIHQSNLTDEAIDAAMTYAADPETQAALARKVNKVWSSTKPTADETALAFSDAVFSLMSEEEADAFIDTVSMMLTALVTQRVTTQGENGQRSNITA